MKVWPTIARLLREEGRCVLVSVVRTDGSVPREVGARMIVSNGRYSGTIGGGALEWQAIAAAQAMLGSEAGSRLTTHALGPELGQCCGGRVSLLTEVFERGALAQVELLAEREERGPFSVTGRIVSPQFEEQFGEARRKLYLYGAGHVGRALILALAPLSFDVLWIDGRANAFPAAVPQNVTCVQEARVASAPPQSFVLVMTHSHALDQEIVAEALGREDIPFVGLIGSATKRARFESRLKALGLSPAALQRLHCPIGIGGIRSKLPAAIAASTAAQLLAQDELLRSSKNPVNIVAGSARLAGGE
jgi:xanthine dehydrogenase accessory factor